MKDFPTDGEAGLLKRVDHSNKAHVARVRFYKLTSLPLGQIMPR